MFLDLTLFSNKPCSISVLHIISVIPATEKNHTMVLATDGSEFEVKEDYQTVRNMMRQAVNHG